MNKKQLQQNSQPRPSPPMPLNAQLNAKIRREVQVAFEIHPKLEIQVAHLLYNSGEWNETEIKNEYGAEMLTLLKYFSHFQKEYNELS